MSQRMDLVLASNVPHDVTQVLFAAWGDVLLGVRNTAACHIRDALDPLVCCVRFTATSVLLKPTLVSDQSVIALLVGRLRGLLSIQLRLWKLWIDHLHRFSQRVHALDHGVNVLLLSGVPNKKNSGTSCFLISPMTWGTTVPSAFVLRAVIVVVQLLGSCGLFAAAVVHHEVLACGYYRSPAAGSLLSTRSGSALVCSFAVTVNHPSGRCFLWTAVLLSVAERCSVTSRDFAFRSVSAHRRRHLRVRQARSASAELTPPRQCDALVSARHWLTRRAVRSSHVPCCSWSDGLTTPGQLAILSTDVVVLCVFRFGLWVALPPKLSRCDSSAAVAAAFGCVPRGQWALLDADVFALIDGSSCLLEPLLVGIALLIFPVLVQAAPGSSSAATGRCSRISPSRGLVEGLVVPRSSFREPLCCCCCCCLPAASGIPLLRALITTRCIPAAAHQVVMSCDVGFLSTLWFRCDSGVLELFGWARSGVPV